MSGLYFLGNLRFVKSKNDYKKSLVNNTDKNKLEKLKHELEQRYIERIRVKKQYKLAYG